MRKKLLVLPILLLLVLSVLSANMTGVSALDSPYIKVVPESTVTTDLTVGMLYTVSIYTDCAQDDITMYQFTLSYDPSILEGLEVTNGDLIVGGSAKFLPGPFDNGAGKLSLTVGWFFTEGEVTSGPGTLATVTFRVVGIGPSQITIGDETKLKGWDWWSEPPDYNIIYAAEMPTHIQPGFFDNTGAPAYPPYPPEAVITAEPDAYTNEPVTFSGVNSYDLDGTLIVSYEWDFGDETTGTGETIDHTYTTVGIYTVTLRVTDEQSQVSDPATHTMTIKERPPYAADLVKWKVKPETSHWVESKDTGGMVTLTALARNLGSKSVDIEIIFAILDARRGTPVGDPLVATATLPYGPEIDVLMSVDLDPYLYGYDGTTKQVLYAHVTLRYDSDGNGTYDTSTTPKIIRFAVVP